MTKNLYQIIYGSAATTLFSKSDLISLLDHSRRRNKQTSITGALFYRDGSFLQLIEGPEEKVKRLFEIIKQDRSHKGIFSFIEGPIANRDFSDWSMAFYDFANELDRIPDGFSDLFCNLSPRNKLQSYPEYLRPFLKIYLRNL